MKNLNKMKNEIFLIKNKNKIKNYLNNLEFYL